MRLALLRSLFEAVLSADSRALQKFRIQSCRRLCWLGLATAGLGAAPLWFGGDSNPDRAAANGFRDLWQRSPGAVAQFQRALILEPSSPFRWADLAEAYGQTGRGGLASLAFGQALRWGPRVPQIGLRASWHYFAVGQPENALAAAGRVLRQSSQFDEALFAAFTEYGAPVRDVLAIAIGDSSRAGQQYLLFLLEQDDSDAAADAVWAHLDRHRAADQKTQLRYAAHLLRNGRHGEAARISRSARDPEGDRNRLHNGGFETEWGTGPFDWEVQASGAYTVSSDTSQAFEGKRALRVRFHGAENVELREIGQLAVLGQGRYRLRARLRTKGVTTDEGVGVRVVAPPISGRALGSTPRLSGTHEWTELSTEFQIAVPDQLVRIEVVRERSHKLVNEIEGIVWIDDVRLERTP